MPKISVKETEEFIDAGKAKFDLYKTTADGEVHNMTVTVRPITVYEITELTRKALQNVEDPEQREKFSKMIRGDEHAVEDVPDNDIAMFNLYYFALYGAYAIRDSFDCDIDKIVRLILSCDASCLIELKNFAATISGFANG